MNNYLKHEETTKENRKFHFPINFWSVAVFSLILILLSYALYIRSLGFYVDDWPQLYSLVVRGLVGIKSYFLYDDRPFAWWPVWLFYKIWGTNPIGWHLTNYLLRWLTGLGIWGTFIQLWPKHKREIFWVVLLFAVYPVFKWQSASVAYIGHWTSYALFFLSLYLMSMAVYKPKYRYLFIILSLVSNALNLFTYEYFIGAEFIRPLLLWIAFSQETKRKRMKRTTVYWLPYLSMAIFYIIWRVFLLNNLRGLDPTLFKNIVVSPISTFVTLINYVLRDVAFSIVTSWFPAINPANIDFTVPYLSVAIILFVIITGGLIILLHLDRQKTPNEDSSNLKFSINAMVVGIAGVFMGCAPAWLILKSASNLSGLWDDRFAIPAIWAAALFIVGFLSIMMQGQRFKRELVIAVILGLAVSQNFRITNDFKWATIWQQRFFSQLGWRVPNVESKTNFVSDNELFTRTGVWGATFALNLFYPPSQLSPEIDYFFLNVLKYFPKRVNDLNNGLRITEKFWYMGYDSDTRRSVVINWTQSNTECLWVLSNNDRYNPLITGDTRQALQVSDLSLIKVSSDFQPDVNLFGIEERNTWCYYYERADLARQFGEWEKVLSIYNEANALGYEASNGIELMPFIEAFARTGKADVAMDLTKLAKVLTTNMRDYSCDNWNRIAKDMQGDAVFDAEYESYSKQDLCWEVK